MRLIKRIATLAICYVVSFGFVSIDFNGPDGLPGVTRAWADDDGGGRGNGRGNGRRGYSHDGDGPTLLRPLRKRKARVRRAVRQPVEQAQYEPRTLIARGLTDQTIAALGERGYRVVERHALTAGAVVVKLRIPAGNSLERARQEVRTAEPAALVDYNHYYRPDSIECTGRRCLMRQISGWPLQQEPSLCRTTATIGLIDTRINTAHPALAGSRITVLNLFDADSDRSGAHHGTAVAALLVGQGDIPGLVRDSEILAVDAFRKGDIATGLDLARAVDMLVARSVPIINMSLSGPDNLLLGATISAAIDRNIMVIAAAGNDGPRAAPAYPAAYAGVLAVTAVDQARNVYRRAARGPHIDIAAPGVNVWTAASVKGQKPRSGTSFAAPFVTAAAALILAQNPGFAREEIELILANEADDLGTVGRDEVFGWGLLDIRNICSG